MRSGRVGFLNHTLDFAQLFHQVQLCGQSPCGVDQHNVLAARLAGHDGVKADRSWVAIFLADDLDRIAVSPHTELLTRSGAKSVGRRQQHRSTFIGQMTRELAY